MTIGTEPRIESYSGNGTAGPFTVDFQFFEIDVFVDGVLLTNGVEYIIDQPGGAGTKGEVLFVPGFFPTGGQAIAVVGSTALNQGLDLVGEDEFDADNVELALDRLYASAQEIRAFGERTIRAPQFGATFPPLDFEANPDTVVSVNSSGVPELKTTDDVLGGAVSAAASSASSAAISAAEAVTSATNSASFAASASSAQTAAEAARDKAEQWAEEDEDVEVEPGEFSAFHWAMKAQAAVNVEADAVAYNDGTTQLPGGPENVQDAIEALASQQTGPQEQAASDDLIPLQDASDSDNPKRATAQSVAETARVEIELMPFDLDTEVASGGGAGGVFFRVPAWMNGYNITAVAAAHGTAGSGPGETEIQLRNVTQAADILSTPLTIDSGDTDSSTAGTPAVINASEDDLTTGDLIRVDIDDTASIPGLGLIVSITAERPPS
jgi:hypothetical protein